MTPFEALLENWKSERLPASLANRTQRVYDLLAGIYPISSYLFHEKAHRRALELTGINDGTRVLEIAVGSGEMFSKIAARNPKGLNVGLDLSPAMSATTQARLKVEHPEINTSLGAANACAMPFANGCFDNVICCFLLELVSDDDAVRTLHEVYRVLKPGGKFTLIFIGQNLGWFNQLYKIAARIVPAFLGRQIDARGPQLLEHAGFRIETTEVNFQRGYPSRIIISRRD